VDFEGDGLCDLGDPDDDNDNVLDGDDSAPFDPNVCRDLDSDTCDDCSSGVDDPANDGPDFDSDGACDAGDLDDDNDGVGDAGDCRPFAPGVASAPGPVGDTLRVNGGELATVQWLRGVQGHTSNLYTLLRSSGEDWPGDFACEVSESPHASVTYSSVPESGGIVYFLVASRNACGESALEQVGNTCEPLNADTDGDLVPDLEDNCALVSNPEQEDDDLDFVGNACE